MVDWIYYEKSGTNTRRAVSIITNLKPIEGGVSLLTIQGVTLLDIDEVDAWLYAIDFTPSERKNACRQLLSDGKYSVCNIEHRLEFVVSTFE